MDCCRQNPDISFGLMDIKMPVINGIEATKLICEFRPELPIIITTAYTQTGDEHRLTEAGCNDYISKPIIMEKLFFCTENKTKFSLINWMRYMVTIFCRE